MKSKIKMYIKKFLGKKGASYFKHLKNVKNKFYEKDNKIVGIIKSAKNIKVYYDKNKGIELKKLLKNIKIDNISGNCKFYYYIDFFKTVCCPNIVIGNLCLDYSIILNNSLEDLKIK